MLRLSDIYINCVHLEKHVMGEHRCMQKKSTEGTIKA